LNIDLLVKKQQDFFATGQTRALPFRIAQLRKLEQLLRQNEAQLYEAIDQDFKRSDYLTYITELSIIYHEIKTMIAKLPRWAKPKRVPTNLANMPGTSYIIPEPYGSALIIGTWNYPYQLSLMPAIAAIAAGNTVIIKPSELTPRVATVLADLINNNFESDFFHVVNGGVETVTELLKQRFNKIFFTGSTAIGKIVMRAAAEHLTSVTLELGGKSPVVVWKDAPLEITARRIAWGKLMNAGQTCVAPDYLLVHHELYEPLLAALKQEFATILGDDLSNNELFPRIINQRHLERLKRLIEPEKVYYGGVVDEVERIISPTIMVDVAATDPVMQEEIFGPILPVIKIENETEAVAWIRQYPQPLSFYLFTKDKRLIKYFNSTISYGGATINDTIMHLCNNNLPFGGVQDSGLGNYHGKFGFDTFSHFKSVQEKVLWFDPPLKYLPITDWKRKLARLLME